MLSLETMERCITTICPNGKLTFSALRANGIDSLNALIEFPDLELLIEKIKDYLNNSGEVVAWDLNPHTSFRKSLNTVLQFCNYDIILTTHRDAILETLKQWYNQEKIKNNRSSLNQTLEVVQSFQALGQFFEKKQLELELATYLAVEGERELGRVTQIAEKDYFLAQIDAGKEEFFQTVDPKKLHEMIEKIYCKAKEISKDPSVFKTTENFEKIHESTLKNFTELLPKYLSIEYVSDESLLEISKGTQVEPQVSKDGRPVKKPSKEEIDDADEKECKKEADKEFEVMQTEETNKNKDAKEEDDDTAKVEKEVGDVKAVDKDVQNHKNEKKSQDELTSEILRWKISNTKKRNEKLKLDFQRLSLLYNKVKDFYETKNSELNQQVKDLDAEVKTTQEEIEKAKGEWAHQRKRANALADSCKGMKEHIRKAESYLRPRKRRNRKYRAENYYE